MSYVDEVIEQVVAQNPAEPEFHQAVKEVLESLRAVVEANEEAFRRDALLERLVNPERQFKFRVPWVDDKGQINVRAKVNNTDGKLLEGMNVTVLVENLVRGQLAVPKSAVVIRDNQEVLFRLGPENKAMWTYVNVMMSNSDSHVVAPNLDKGAELNAGDVIITSGNLNLADGSQVEVRKP